MGILRSIWELLTKASPAKIKGADPRPYLSGERPGLWASNHRAEAAQCKGWQFVAVRSLARMASQAELSVHQVSDTGNRLEQVNEQLRLARWQGDKTRIAKLKRKRRRIVQKADAPTAQGVKTDRKPVRPSDPLLRLLQRPNREWSLMTFLFAAQQQLSLTGSALIWVVRNGLGVPAELYLLPTGLCDPRPPSTDFPVGSWYLQPLSAWGLSSPYAGGPLGTALLTGAEIDARDVKVIRWPHPLYLSDGLSPLAAGALWVDVANEMDKACWYAMQNAERPGMLFFQSPEIDPDPADVIRFREDLRSDHAGAAATGKHLLMPKGITAESRGRAPADMDFPNGRQQYRDANLALHAVSPIAAGITEAGSYAAANAAIKQTTELAVQPSLTLIAGELTELLGDVYPGRKREITLTARAIDDPQVLEQRLRTDIQAGNALRVNEYRALRGLPAIPAPEGEQFVGQRTTVRVEDSDPEKPGLQGGDRDDDSGAKTDGPGDDRGSGAREEHRDAPPGRNSDRNGKAHVNGRRW